MAHATNFHLNHRGIPYLLIPIQENSLWEVTKKRAQEFSCTKNRNKGGHWQKHRLCRLHPSCLASWLFWRSDEKGIYRVNTAYKSIPRVCENIWTFTGLSPFIPFVFRRPYPRQHPRRNRHANRKQLLRMAKPWRGDKKATNIKQYELSGYKAAHDTMRVNRGPHSGQQKTL